MHVTTNHTLNKPRVVIGFGGGTSKKRIGRETTAARTTGSFKNWILRNRRREENTNRNLSGFKVARVAY